jgi:hypothetical protein
LACACSDLIDYSTRTLQITGFDQRLGKQQQHVRVPKQVDVHGILLRWCPATGYLFRATRFFMSVFLGAVGTAIANVSNPTIL